jgi:hypothetical protein
MRGRRCVAVQARRFLRLHPDCSGVGGVAPLIVVRAAGRTALGGTGAHMRGEKVLRSVCVCGTFQGRRACVEAASAHGESALPARHASALIWAHRTFIKVADGGACPGWWGHRTYLTLPHLIEWELLICRAGEGRRERVGGGRGKQDVIHAQGGGGRTRLTGRREGSAPAVQCVRRPRLWPTARHGDGVPSHRTGPPLPSPRCSLSATHSDLRPFALRSLAHALCCWSRRAGAVRLGFVSKFVSQRSYLAV